MFARQKLRFFMFLNIQKHIIHLLCVILLLLIQIDMCTPNCYSIIYQTGIAESVNLDELEEEGIDEEIIFRAGKQSSKFYFITGNNTPIDYNTIIISISIKDDDPVPKFTGDNLVPDIFNCTFRI